MERVVEALVGWDVPIYEDVGAIPRGWKLWISYISNKVKHGSPFSSVTTLL